MAEETEAVPAEYTDVYLAWQNSFPFEQREMSPRDWVQLGAALDLNDPDVKATPNTVWSSANAWRVPRSEIPLTDLQLGRLLGVDSRFRIIEG